MTLNDSIKLLKLMTHETFCENSIRHNFLILAKDSIIDAWQLLFTLNLVWQLPILPWDSSMLRQKINHGYKWLYLRILLNSGHNILKNRGYPWMPWRMHHLSKWESLKKWVSVPLKMNLIISKQMNPPTSKWYN